MIEAYSYSLSLFPPVINDDNDYGDYDDNVAIDDDVDEDYSDDDDNDDDINDSIVNSYDNDGGNDDNNEDDDNFTFTLF